MAKHNFSIKKPINKGWSQDKKYYVKENNQEYLLRISPIELLEKRKELFSYLKKVEALGVPMCKPVEVGVCAEGVYLLQTWINGVDANDEILNLTKTQQYALGIESGKILKKIHSLKAPKKEVPWEEKFFQKTDKKIKNYQECPLTFPGDDKIINYLNKNFHLLKNRPQCFQHGDYHLGNMMIENGKLIIIDFDRNDFGDPYEEFNRIVWCAKVSPHFATGQLNGYFNGDVPLEFFKLLAFYIASNTLSSIYWAIPFGKEEVEMMMNLSQEVLKWYDNMKNPIPTWYLKGEVDEKF